MTDTGSLAFDPVGENPLARVDAPLSSLGGADPVGVT